MILVDTSAWLDLFRQRKTEAATRLRRVLDDGEPYAITAVVYQELLQDAADEGEFKTLHEYLTTQVMLHPKHPVQTYGDAARLYFDCRRSGVTIRSTIDCLIAQIAIESGARLLHNDRDFDRIAQVATKLKIA